MLHALPLPLAKWSVLLLALSVWWTITDDQQDASSIGDRLALHRTPQYYTLVLFSANYRILTFDSHSVAQIQQHNTCTTNTLTVQYW